MRLPPMEFTSSEALQDFLADWLTRHGHQVYRQIPCPEGGEIDLLTQDYAIECRQALTPEVLLEAQTVLGACASHIAQLQPVVAGQTPEASEAIADLENTLKALQDKGIEVWFVDQIPALQSFYAKVKEGGDLRETAAKPRRWNPWAGVGVAGSMALILAVSFGLAYQILREPVSQRMSTEERLLWDRLHEAAAVWDQQTAERQLQTLSRSQNPCLARFAQRFQTQLEQQGALAFRDINPLKRALNQQEGCRLEETPFEFSP